MNMEAIERMGREPMNSRVGDVFYLKCKRCGTMVPYKHSEQDGKDFANGIFYCSGECWLSD